MGTRGSPRAVSWRSVPPGSQGGGRKPPESGWANLGPKEESKKVNERRVCNRLTFVLAEGLSPSRLLTPSTENVARQETSFPPLYAQGQAQCLTLSRHSTNAGLPTRTSLIFPRGIIFTLHFSDCPWWLGTHHTKGENTDNSSTHR